MLHPNIAPGVHQVAEPYVNWYIIEDDSGDLTVVDCGLPASWDSLLDSLPKLGRSLSDIKAVVLTHAHFDHVGFAEKLRSIRNIPVWVHEREVPNTQHPLSYEHERSRLWYSLNPTCMAAMATFIADGMLQTPAIRPVLVK